MTKVKLHNKIINLEDFFEKAALKLKERVGFKRLCFLIPNEYNGDYITKHSTFGLSICLTRKDFHRLHENYHEDILYPNVAWQRCGFVNQIFLTIHWKIRLRRVSVVMPIYRDGIAVCLILFFDQRANGWLRKHNHYAYQLQEEIARSLEAILLYNQTIERIIREYDHSNEQLAYRKSISDEPTTVLIGKKVEFL